MIDVYIHSANHFHSPGVQDALLMMRNGARDAGHSAYITDLPVPDSCSIFLEHFIEDSHWKMVRDAKTIGCRTIIVCTELISASGFNCELSVSTGGAHYADTRYWERRFAGFQAAITHTDEVWVLADSVVPDYQAALPGMPIRVLPHGWVSNFQRVDHEPEERKDIDFFFSGSLTPFRVDILNRLAKHHRVAVSPQGAPDYLRLDLLARAKVCLSLPLSPANRLPSLSRLHFHLQNANFVLQLQHQDSCALDPYVLHAPAADFGDWAVAALGVDNRRACAEASALRFRTEMPLARWIGPLLQEPRHAAAALPLAPSARSSPHAHAQSAMQRCGEAA